MFLYYITKIFSFALDRIMGKEPIIHEGKIKVIYFFYPKQQQKKENNRSSDILA
jgi:hypothetical protein